MGERQRDLPDSEPGGYVCRDPVQAHDDREKSENSVYLYLALKLAKVPTELHIYAGALHGFGVRPVNNPCRTWTRSCAEWMRHQGFLHANTP